VNVSLQRRTHPPYLVQIADNAALTRGKDCLQTLICVPISARASRALEARWAFLWFRNNVIVSLFLIRRPWIIKYFFCPLDLTAECGFNEASTGTAMAPDVDVVAILHVPC
jgi:hypothetical protein